MRQIYCLKIYQILDQTKPGFIPEKLCKENICCYFPTHKYENIPKVLEYFLFDDTFSIEVILSSKCNLILRKRQIKTSTSSAWKL